jgi:hypothetical protein
MSINSTMRGSPPLEIAEDMRTVQLPMRLWASPSRLGFVLSLSAACSADAEARLSSAHPDLAPPGPRSGSARS